MKQKTLLISLFILFISCSKEENDIKVKQPIIQLNLNNIELNSANVQIILKDYNIPQELGIVWQKSSIDNSGNSKTFETVSDTISHQITQLESGMEYKIRSYLLFENDTVYSSEKIFTTGKLEKTNEIIYSLDLAYNDRGVAVCETFDGGFVTGGYAINYFGYRENKILIKKISSDFQPIWELVINDYFSLRKIIEAPNKDLFVLIDGHGYEDIHPILYRLSSDGKIIWKKEFLKNKVNSMHDLFLSADNLFMIGTTTYEPLDRKGWFLKLDLNGNIISENIYPAEKFLVGRSISLSDNNLYAAGNTNEGAMFTKLDLEGNPIWYKKIGSTSDVVTAMLSLNGEFYLAGITRRLGPVNSQNIWLIKLDRNGDVSWEKGLGKLYWNFSTVTNSTYIDYDSFGNIFLTGIGGPGTPKMHSNAWLFKINSSTGEMLWQKDFGSNENYTWDGGFAITITNTNDIIVVGEKEDSEENTISMTTDVWVQRFKELKF